ncbi:protein arginine N-methyltransferase 9-like [Oppia nitens]|uniref:protein arginine N-methyltransferase 9-like n=1 Tax=Oppia nitens TaxID=1686743 RepID=UPI0023DCDDE9|nr:protein arginine N-methyltransferase 9-like [Oppia nitens]
MSAKHKNCVSNTSVEKLVRKAVKCLKYGQYGSSCGHFCVAFKVCLNCHSHESYKELTTKWLSTFLYAFDRHIQHLETNADNQTIMNAFCEAIESLPNCEDLHYNKGIYCYKKGFLSKSVDCFVSSLALNPNYNLSHLCLENIKSSAIARWHYIMINDIKRNTIFKEAIHLAVQKGYNTVLDIGTGSGLLSLYSVEAGAREVYACEVSEMLYHLCKDVLKVNSIDDKVILFNEMSTNLTIPQMIPKPIHLVVTEIFDAGLFGEHVLSTIYSAHKEIIDPNHGMVVPNKATVYGVLIDSDELREYFTVNRKQFGNLLISDNIIIGVDFNDMKYTTINLTKVKNKKFLSKPFPIIDINFNDIIQIEKLLESDYSFNIDVECVSSGKLDAIAVWFDLNLIDDLHISTQPPTELIGWEQAIYPITYKPLLLQPNTRLVMSFTLNEDFLKLIDFKIFDNEIKPNKDLEIIYLNSDLVKYLNATIFYEAFIKSLNLIIESENISKIIDFSYFPVSSLHCIKSQLLSQLVIVNDDNDIQDNIKHKHMTNHLILLDFVEPSGLMRSNLLEKLAYLSIYSVKTPTFMPYKVTIKALLIQSEDLIMRSRLVSDHNVNGYQIKKFLNIFETEIMQNIDVSKLDFLKLSSSFELLNINFCDFFKSKCDINTEPSNECIVDVIKDGKFHAILYWYELYLTNNIVINTLDMSPNWYSAAFIVKEPMNLINNNKIHISCIFTNGFLRFKDMNIVND